MRFSKIVLSAVTIFVLALTGCSYHEDKSNKNEGPVSPSTNTPSGGGASQPPGGRDRSNPDPRYSAIFDQILKSKCLGCHTGPAAKRGVDLSSYESLLSLDPPILVPGRPEDSDLYLSVAKGRMPFAGPPLTEGELQQIFEWIKNGALNN
jgi:hypothetical protein